MVDTDDLRLIDEEKLAELEKEKKKRRRVGRLMIFWRRFRRHKMGVFGLSIIVFITLVAIFAPYIANPGRFIPYGPTQNNPPAQYLPPLGYEPKEDSIASQKLSGMEKTIAAIYFDRSIAFINGISQQNLSFYQVLSQIDSIVSADTETELWADSEGSFNHSSGVITLTDTTFTGTALVDYRVAGKTAVKITVSETTVYRVNMHLKVDADTAESKWPLEVYMHVFEANANFETDDPLGSAKIEGYNIKSGKESGVIYASYMDFDFSPSAKVTPGNTYWLVIDAQILDAETEVDLRFYADSTGDGLDLTHTKVQNWNALEGWTNDYRITSEGWIPQVKVFYTTNKIHILGTDTLGRDILSATIHGARTSLFVASVAISIQVLIGIFLGAIAGYFGGKVDSFIMRVTDIFLSIPNIFLILIAITIWEQISLLFIALTLGLFNWSGTARIIRAEFLSLREMEYTDAARALGVPDRTIIFKHLLPNALAPVIVTATLGVATVILIEAGLSFLGFGDPSAVSWGTAIQWGMSGNTLRFAPWVATIPGIAIFIAVVGFNLMGDALRDALDPRLKN